MTLHGVGGAFLQRFAGQCEIKGMESGKRLQIQRLGTSRSQKAHPRQSKLSTREKQTLSSRSRTGF
ncbi:hypothetical protein L210DRAFT_947704, partial [Boletus edulis BED1]